MMTDAHLVSVYSESELKLRDYVGTSLISAWLLLLLAMENSHSIDLV